ncbi:MAG: CAAX prenyl protease-related protein [Tepidisphaeraceae bacterium]
MTAPLQTPNDPLADPAPPQPAPALAPPVKWWRRDDVAYAAPMLVFLSFTQLGVSFNDYYPLSYIAKVIVVSILLVYSWKHYTKIRWDFWWLGVIVGVVGIFQWVGMQLWLQNHFSYFAPPGAEDIFNPFLKFSSPATAWSFIAVRMIGAVLVVPVMEELFWRDFLWREIIAPNDFKLAKVGEFEWPAVLIVAGAFALVHGNWWLTSIVWALMIAALLIYTKSLGACIIAHAVTNLLLALYVLKTQDWAFW